MNSSTALARFLLIVSSNLQSHLRGYQTLANRLLCEARCTLPVMTSAPNLGSPPEFRPDGGDPPLTSPPIVVLDRLAAVDRRPSLADRIRGIDVSFGLLAGPRTSISLDSQRKWTELRRFRSTTYWEREPQTIQLAPGVATERTVQLSVGMSREHTEMLASAVSVKARGDLRVVQQEISEKWSESVGETLRFDIMETHIETLRLENPNADPEVYRRFAIWSVVHEYVVDRLDGIELTRDFEPDELEQLRSIPAIWSPIVPPIRVTTSSTVVTSSIDVPRAQAMEEPRA
jgi:hypothetical protein